MTRINIDDDMIRRFREAAGPYLGLPKAPFATLLSEEAVRSWKKEVARGILEKTLNEPFVDRRTGPKDGRVKQDDTCSWSRRMSNFGQRDDDKCWADLPRKSDRLKREAEEREKQRAQEIHVSEGMLYVADILRAHHAHFGFDRPSDTQIYRAMRLQEMKERGQ